MRVFLLSPRCKQAFKLPSQNRPAPRDSGLLGTCQVASSRASRTRLAFAKGYVTLPVCFAYNARALGACRARMANLSPDFAAAWCGTSSTLAEFASQSAPAAPRTAESGIPAVANTAPPIRPRDRGVSDADLSSVRSDACRESFAMPSRERAASGPALLQLSSKDAPSHALIEARSAPSMISASSAHSLARSTSYSSGLGRTLAPGSALAPSGDAPRRANNPIPLTVHTFVTEPLPAIRPKRGLGSAGTREDERAPAAALARNGTDGLVLAGVGAAGIGVVSAVSTGIARDYLVAPLATQAGQPRRPLPRLHSPESPACASASQSKSSGSPVLAPAAPLDAPPAPSAARPRPGSRRQQRAAARPAEANALVPSDDDGVGGYGGVGGVGGGGGGSSSERAAPVTDAYANRPLSSGLAADELARTPCLVCRTALADTLTLPCGHLCSCDACARARSDCALCHARITHRTAFGGRRTARAAALASASPPARADAEADGSPRCAQCRGPPDAVLLPCEHCALCMACASSGRLLCCPVCACEFYGARRHFARPAGEAGAQQGSGAAGRGATSGSRVR